MTMTPLNVFLNMEASIPIYVGRLAYQSGQSYFEFDKEFLTRNINISPLKLTLSNELQLAERNPFNGLHGVFADSLPDGWGLLLMDRWLRMHGVNLSRLTPLDRLAYMGNRGMGALTYEPDSGIIDSDPNEILSLSNLADNALAIYQGTATDVSQQLYLTGGSPGGARPKSAIGIKGDIAIANTVNLPNGYEHWLVKFPTDKDKLAQSEGVIEYIYSLMARNAGIPFPETQLIQASRTMPFFACKRFDRSEDNRRIHMHSFAGMVHADFRIPDADYETLMKVVSHVVPSHPAMVDVFRRMVFNILSGNRDDHTKNFSFMMSARGEWSFSPAYDITFNTGINGHHSMSVGGEGLDISRAAIQRIADLIPLKTAQVRIIIEEVCEALSHWLELSANYDVPKEKAIEIQHYIDAGVKRICR